MSNRNRIARMAEEVKATDLERKEAAKKRAASPSTPRAKKKLVSGRIMAVWAVKDGRGEIVATFPYPRKDMAESEAKRLKEANRKTYIVCPHKVPFEG